MADPKLYIGPYEILGSLGTGGMATVFHGRSKKGQEVAIKVIRFEHAAKGHYVERFLRELKVTSGLDHPNIIDVIDCGTHEGQPYYVMEYLPYPSLEDLLQDRGPMEETFVRRLCRPIFEGMAFYDSVGVVHRDLKPSNVIVRPDGSPVIMDFGLVFDPTRTALTRTGELVGTPIYMPPETFRGQRLDIRGDIYQWGVICHECLTGTVPFEGTTVGQMALEVVAGNARPLLERAPKTTPSFVAFIANCMAHHIGSRYRNPRAALKDLRRVERGQPIKLRDTKSAVAAGLQAFARPSITVGEPPPAAATQQVDRLEAPGRPHARRLAVGFATAVAIVLATVGLVWLYHLVSPLPPPLPTPHLTPGYRRLGLSWKSPMNLRTKLTLTSKDGSVVHEESEGSSCRHHRYLVPLEKARKTSLCVALTVLPAGPRSTGKRVRLFEPRFSIDELLRVSGGLLVELRPRQTLRPGTRLTLHVVDTGGQRYDAPLAERGDSFTASISDPGPDIAGIELVVALPATQEEFTVDLKGAFRKWATGLFEPCNHFRENDILLSVLRDLLGEMLSDSMRKLRVFEDEGIVDEERLARLGAEAREHVTARLEQVRVSAHARKWAQAIFAMAPSQEVLLASPLLSLPERVMVFEHARMVNVLNHSFLARNWPPFSHRLWSFGPDWSFSWTGHPPSSDRWRRLRGWQLPSDQAEITGFELGTLLVTDEQLTRQFDWDMTAEEIATLERGLLCFEIHRLPKRLRLQVHVNASPALLVLRHMTECRRDRRRRTWFRHAFDATYLREGTNRLTIRGGMAPGFLREKKSILLRRVLLCGQ